MANIFEPSAEQECTWLEFVKSRPEAVRRVAERFTPWTLYRLKGSGHRVTVYSFHEHGDGFVSLTVNVTGDFNQVMFDRQVFGIAAEDLEECDLPSEGEPLGTFLSSDEANDNIDNLRVMVRPDLWEMAEDGTAKRRT